MPETRGRPPGQAPPPQRGQRALTFLGGGVLVLAVAGGAWALFGRDQKSSPATAIGPQVPASAPANKVFGPAVPGASRTTPVTATSTAPVAASPKATAAAPTATAKATPKAAPPATRPTAPKPAAQPGAKVATQAYTFRVSRGDTLWSMTRVALARTGRPVTNANVAAYVQKLYQANADKIGADPDLIYRDQVIVWPQGL